MVFKSTMFSSVVSINIFNTNLFEIFLIITRDFIVKTKNIYRFHIYLHDKDSEPSGKSAAKPFRTKN